MAQGEGRVAVGAAVRGGEGVVGHGQRTADAEVVVLQVVQPAFRSGQLTGQDVRGEGPARGEPGGHDAEGEREAAGEFDERVGRVEAVPAGYGTQQRGTVLAGQGCQREPGAPSSAVSGDRLVTITAQPVPAGSNGRT